MTSLINTVRTFSITADQFQNARTPQSIMGAAMSELGETAIEVNIEAGHSYKSPSPDGVVGEAVDTIMCLLDLIYKHDPNFTEAQLVEIATAKGAKWIEKLSKHSEKK